MKISYRITLMLLGVIAIGHAEEHVHTARNLRRRGFGMGGPGSLFGGDSDCRDCFVEGCFLDPIETGVTDPAECTALDCANLDCGEDFEERVAGFYCRRCNSPKCSEENADDEDCKLCPILECPESLTTACADFQDDFQELMTCRACHKCDRLECDTDPPPSQMMCDRNLCFMFEAGECDPFLAEEDP